MAAPRAPGAGGAGWRLAGIGLLGVGVAAAIYTAGRCTSPTIRSACSIRTRSRPSRCWRPSCTLGFNRFPPKSLLATIVLGLAVVQVLVPGGHSPYVTGGCPP